MPLKLKGCMVSLQTSLCRNSPDKIASFFKLFFLFSSPNMPPAFQVGEVLPEGVRSSPMLRIVHSGEPMTMEVKPGRTTVTIDRSTRKILRVKREGGVKMPGHFDPDELRRSLVTQGPGIMTRKSLVPM
jgi:hypothetical protein